MERLIAGMPCKQCGAVFKEYCLGELYAYGADACCPKCNYVVGCVRITANLTYYTGGVFNTFERAVEPTNELMEAVKHGGLKEIYNSLISAGSSVWRKFLRGTTALLPSDIKIEITERRLGPDGEIKTVETRVEFEKN